MDNVLLWTILMIFVGAVSGMVIRYRTRDKCLKAFAGYFAVVEQTNGKTIWGRLDVFHNAIELIYPTPHPDKAGTHHETSFILYQDQFAEIRAIQRFYDELSEKNQKRREEEIRRTYRPNAFRRIARRLRNLLNLLRDAMVQAVGAFLGSAKKMASSTLLSTQDARITDTARTLLSSTASAYEPILERYVGRKVVLEIFVTDGVREYCGILKDYSEEFICVLDVPVSEVYAFHLGEPEQLKINHDLEFDVQATQRKDAGKAMYDFTVVVHNRGSQRVHVAKAEADGFTTEFGRDLNPGDTIELNIHGVPAKSRSGSIQVEGGAIPDVRLMIRARRFMDLVVPRSRGTIRHGAEQLPRFQL